MLISNIEDPYYEDDKDNTIDNAKSLFNNDLNKTRSVAGNKPVWITESGWPTTGPTFGKAVPSIDNAKRYWDEVGCELFGTTNTWWYNLRDTNPANAAKFAITSDLSSTPSYNLTCPAGSGAPNATNLNSAGVSLRSGQAMIELILPLAVLGVASWMW
jgi:glucan endo-1,3-beta-D-glucosidase